MNITAMVLSLRLKPFEKNMFSSDHEHADEWGDFSKLVLTGDRKAEEAKSAHIILDSLRNPKS